MLLTAVLQLDRVLCELAEDERERAGHTPLAREKMRAENIGPRALLVITGKGDILCRLYLSLPTPYPYFLSSLTGSIIKDNITFISP